MSNKNGNGGNGRREKTRARILKAAKSIITQQGMEKTTIRKIAIEAKVSPGLVIQYFGTKAGLVQEIFLESNKILLDIFKDRMDSATSFEELTQGALEAMSARDLHNPDLTRQVMAFTWLWGADEEKQFSKTLQDMSEVVANSMSAQFLPESIEIRRVASFALVNMYVGYLRIALQESWSPQRLNETIIPSVNIIIAGVEALANQKGDDASS